MKMSEIAELAGVSVATVSRAFHSPNLVRAEIRNRILEIAEQHKYLYHATAADLSRQKSNVIGVLIPSAKASVFGKTLLAIQEKTQENYSIIFGNTLYQKDLESKLLQKFRERRVAGVILTGFIMGHEERIHSLIDDSIACVVTWEILDSKEISYVGYDNVKAAYSATNYLISLGHERIGLIVGPYQKVGRVRKRHTGYKKALADNGISFDPSLVVSSEPALFEGKRTMQQLLSLPDPPTAVFAASDQLAIGALSAIKERGLRVPKDVSLVGFDDIDVAAYCDPPLTTVRVPAQEMGELAVKVLLEAIEDGRAEVKQYLLDTDLIIRESCAERR
jgi:DNA-binding LacI/PurR family transcriptional regulator